MGGEVFFFLCFIVTHFHDLPRLAAMLVIRIQMCASVCLCMPVHASVRTTYKRECKPGTFSPTHSAAG
jgi:hypothetical protein